MRLAVRTHADPTALARPIRELLRAKDPNIPLAELATMESIVDDTVSDHRVITSSLGLLSSIALFLALIGLYGVLAYHVSQRHHEIGVRMVLGARPTRIANLVLSRGMALVVAGLVIGLTGAYWATRVIQQLLFGVETTDPATFASVALTFGGIALLACVVPAWRAARVDPVITLQAQ
jgi:ABC-type antimicrobial peptide transport system permease subunit